MGTFSNPRVLEWFECGRTELLRSFGLPYAEIENRGVMLPVVESHIICRNRTSYDELLKITTSAEMSGKASVKFDVQIVRDSDGVGVIQGYTVHAITDRTGRPIRPPKWLSGLFHNI